MIKTNTKLYNEDLNTHIILTVEGKNHAEWSYRHSKAIRQLRELGYRRAE